MAKQCPQCKTSHPETLEFCPADGARLVPMAPARSPATDPSQGGAAPPPGRPPVAPPAGRAPRESRFPHTIQRMAPGDAGAPVDAPVLVPSGGSDHDATRLYVTPDEPDGPSLRQLLAKGPMASEQAVERLAVLADLVAAERRGTPPAPLTPDAVRYATPDGRGKPKLVAGHGDPTYLAQYAAPEWDEGQPGPTADVYALGCILFEAITGRAPFQGKSAAEVARKAASAAAPAIRQVRREAEIPPALELEVQRALKKRPGDRHPTADAFAKAIRTAMRDDDRATMALGSGEAAFLQQILAGKTPDEAARAVGGVSPQVLAAAKAQVAAQAQAAAQVQPAAKPASGATGKGAPAQRNDTDRSPAVQAPAPTKDSGPADPKHGSVVPKHGSVVPNKGRSPVPLIVGGVVGAALLGGGLLFALRQDPPPPPAAPPPAPVQVAAPVPPKPPEPDVVEAPDVPPPPPAPDVVEEPDVPPEPDMGVKPTPVRPRPKPKGDKPETKPDDKPKPEPKRDGPITF